VYFVLEPDGDPLGIVPLPESSRVVAATSRRIWVIEVDSLEVESVVRYQVAWP
jgi:hypothetical protein